MDGNSAQWAAGRPRADRRAARGHPVDRRRGRGDPQVDRGRDRPGRRGPRGPRSRRKIGTTRPPMPAGADFVWIDDALPTGAMPHGDCPGISPASRTTRSTAAGCRWPNKAQGLKQLVFEDAGQKLVVGEGDVLFAHVYLDPKQPPREVMLQWHTAGDWTHRAYWGENAIDWGKDGTPERLAMGGLPATRPMGPAGGAGRPAQAGAGDRDRRLGVHPARRHRALGRGRHHHPDPAGRPALRLVRGVAQAQRDAGAAGALPGDLKAAVQLERSEVDRGRRPRRWPPTSPSTPTPRRRGRSGPLRARLAEAEKKRTGDRGAGADDPGLPRAVRRAEAGVLLKRGEYDQRGEKVGRAVPAFLPPLPPGEPVNRLGLARWLVAPNHPLTARVAVNRLLAPGLRHRARQDGRGLRLAGRAAQPSRAARLAGGRSSARTAGTSSG